jgi:hypothetical protein
LAIAREKKNGDPNIVLDTLQVVVELFSFGLVVLVVVLTLLSKKVESEQAYNSMSDFLVISSFLWIYMAVLLVIGIFGSYNDFTSVIGRLNEEKHVSTQNVDDITVLRSL